MGDEEGVLHSGGATTGQWIRRVAVIVMLLLIAATFWARLGLAGSVAIAQAVLTAAPAAAVVILVYFYLAWAPTLAKLRWALKNRAGTAEEYRAHRRTADSAAMSNARSGLGRWIVGLRSGTW